MAKPTQEEMNQWFKTIDLDSSGKIDSKELKTVIKLYYQDCEKKPVDDAKIDADVAVSRFT